MENKWDLSADHKFTPDDLREIMRILMGPEGCPWDRVQTHASIRKNLIEEAYEAVDAIDSGDPLRIKDELGDVLLQVYFHAAIAEKNAVFSLEDISDNISRKLISRHTHVFAKDQANSPDEVLSIWERNKMREKNQTLYAQTLCDIPLGLAALMRSEKLQKRAAKAGFDWPDARGGRDKIKEELKEVEQELQTGDFIAYTRVDMHSEPDRFARVESEIGDLLFAVVNFSRLLGIDSELALNRANDRFVHRFTQMELLANERGWKLDTLDLKQLDELWDEIKEREKANAD